MRAGRYFPGDEESHYFDNPGEAFAESFAHHRFPSDPVPWEWPDFPDPRLGAYPAIQRDALDSWNGDSTERLGGTFRRRRPHRRRIARRIATALDGELHLSLSGPKRADLSLKLKDAAGRVLARSDGAGSHEQIDYGICGERQLTAIVRRHGNRRARFKLTALVP